MDTDDNNLKERYIKLFKFIDKNIDNDSAIKEYIQNLPFGRGGLLYHFKRDFDYTIKDYCFKRKLYLISAMLKQTNKSILDIAIEFGYQHQGAVTSAFKKVYGMTPSEYRKSDIEFEDNYINLEDTKMDNEDKKNNASETYIVWLEEFRCLKHNVRQLKFDVDNVITPFQQLTKAVFESLVKDYDEDLQNITITSSRLNKNEKVIFEKFIFPQLSGENRIVHLDIREISEKTEFTEECIKIVAFDLLRHSVNIEDGDIFAFSKIFKNVTIKGDDIEINITNF